MVTTPTLVPYAEYWVAKWSTRQIGISTIGWSRITEGSSSGTIQGRFMRARALDLLRQHLNSAGPATSSGITSGYRNKPNEKACLAEQRQMFRQRFDALQSWLLAV